MVKYIKLRKPPTEPKRSSFQEDTEEVHKYSYVDESLDNFLDELYEKLNKWPDAKVKLETDYGHCFYEGDRPNAVLKIYRIVTKKEHYNRAMEKFKKRVDEYNDWYNTNRITIDKEIARRNTEGTK